jgi:hypothetical protein
MTRLVRLLPAALMVIGCAHVAPNQAKVDCYVESGWLDSTNGCSARAGYPDCYRVCADGSRVRVQDVGEADAASKAAPPEP